MIYHVVEPSCYQRLTLGLAIPAIASKLGMECKTYTQEDFLAGRIEQDGDTKAIFITESALFRNIHGLGLPELRNRIPNGKIVNLGSDSIYFNIDDRDEFLNCTPGSIDLWLDLIPRSVEYYKEKGFHADVWDWTISERYIDQLKVLRTSFLMEGSFITKVKDYVCLCNMNSPYRQNLQKYLDKREYVGTFGDGRIDTDLIPLYYWYTTAHVAIGTTSPAGQINIRSMKGFRDWIAPFMETILIYDNYPLIVERYGDVCPIYNYEDFESLTDKIDYVKSLSHDMYNTILFNQKQKILERTIEKQFIKLFHEHKIV